ncbi:MAG: hypothetical protein R3330_18760 [Saprospiraceae bacterium]|nr:hypothetical protein [Saprospiraceae bacterium]
MTSKFLFLLCCFALFAQCDAPDSGSSNTDAAGDAPAVVEPNPAKYTSFALTTDAELTDNERQMIPLLIQAARLMDDCFWFEAHGDKQALMASLPTKTLKEFARINYGPWDRLAGNAPFVAGVGAKPAGANPTGCGGCAAVGSSAATGRPGPVPTGPTERRRPTN